MSEETNVCSGASHSKAYKLIPSRDSSERCEEKERRTHWACVESCDIARAILNLGLRVESGLQALSGTRVCLRLGKTLTFLLVDRSSVDVRGAGASGGQATG